MKRVYYLGKTANDITLEVNVSTQGIAYTEVTKKRSGGSAQQIAESKTATGKIPAKSIGKSNKIAESVLEIVTIIDLQTVSEDLWPTCFENLIINYRLTGGADGTQEYEMDKDDKKKSKTGKIIVVVKAIRLTLIK